MAKSDYRDAVRKIKEHIAEGDIYQANLTQAFESETTTPGRELYERLARTNPAPFSAYLRFPPGRMRDGSIDAAYPGIEVISCSPERFWRKSGNVVESRPIKGTRARGNDPLSDRANLRALLESGKDRAELLMITDLERNDLGTIAEIGSVRVAALRRPRAYASVWHLESIVRARLAPGLQWHDVMRAMHPCGSITGAPKRRSVEILNEVESTPRGVYCGAIGWVNAAGDADFSVAIRTAVKIGPTLRVHGGGGIVADSDCDAEYEESLVKIAPMLDSLLPSGIETTTHDIIHEKPTVEAR
ncbi:MAG: anthranilate synthase component I family protein [Candidatus Zixiibacteriota bacterium]